MADTPLLFTFESDACFGAARSTTVLDVDLCTQVDDSGFPFIGGRIVKGLVDEHVAIILRALPDSTRPVWEEAALEALGEPGAVRPGAARFGDARFPPEVRSMATHKGGLAAGLVTRAFTDVRAQTRMDPDRGTAKDHSLRTTRVISQGTQHLTGSISYSGGSLESAPKLGRALLVAALSLIRRGGVNRSRGWGRIRIVPAVDAATLQSWRAPLVAALKGGPA